MEGNSAQAHRMKSDEKPFFCQIYGFFLFFCFLEKNGTCWDWQVFFFISEGFEDFLIQGYHC